MLLFDIVYAHRASGSHHRIALDALRRLATPNAAAWTKLFLKHADLYMRGAKAPDDVFRDSMNHVVHVRDNYWGGAPKKAEEWRARTTELLADRQWPEAVYAAGVLSHYVADPFQPLHTAQSEAEGAVHRAFEQSVGKSYKSLIARLDQSGWPAPPATTGPDWIASLVRGGAEAAVVHYEDCIDHYDLDAGVTDPPAGLDDHLRGVMADALGRAIVGFAATLDQVFADAAVEPPAVDLTAQAYLAALDIPVQWVLRKMEDAEERRLVATMYAEYVESGKVVRELPADDRAVRAAHARDVLRVSTAELDAAPARAPGGLHGRPARAPLVLEPAAAPLTPVDAAPEPETPPADRPVIDAPAIGIAYSARLEAAGVKTIGALLAADPDALADQLGARAVTPATVRDWQAMARLALDVEGLGEQDAEILVGAGVRDRSALAAADARALQEQLEAFVRTEAGRRITRGRQGPAAEKVEALIEAARRAA